RAQVIEAIQTHPGQTTADVARATGLPLPAARRAITALRARGLIGADNDPGKTSRYFPTMH
ncbi:MAG: helix-turn-helix domain-containing protein, partial [Frankiaceae bacterium]|nr:helix-turn-helix domain-containing protein [Frankiaceae bacterium]